VFKNAATRSALGFAAILTIVLVLLPGALHLMDQGFLFRLAQSAAIFIILSVSLNLITGTMGLLSLGHASFYGIGAYISALVAIKFGLPFILCVLISGIATALVGAILAIPLVRLVRLFFAVGTLAVAELIGLVLMNWTPVTHGPMGVRSIPNVSIAGLDLSTRLGTYYTCVVIMLICVWIVHRLTHSYFGNAMRAAREDDQSAAGMGLSIGAMKILVFAISAGLAGVAGSLLAHTTNFISPDMFRLSDSILILTMVVVGGLGSIPGDIAGACLLTLLPELTRDLGHLRTVAVGVVLFVSIIALPHGIIGEIPAIAFVRSKLGRFWRSSPTCGWR
jgi:branched-chain amino acid transport system permease protein